MEQPLEAMFTRSNVICVILFYLYGSVKKGIRNLWKHTGLYDISLYDVVGTTTGLTS